MENKPAKASSLTDLGYKVTPAHGKDEKGVEIAFKVVGPAPTFFIKKTKRGRLFAVKEKDSTVESTINGLYNFKESNGDLVGQRATPTAVSKGKKEPTSAAA